MEIRVIVAAWGKYTWLIRPCLESLQSHWTGMPRNVTVITDDPEVDVPEYVELLVYLDWQPWHYSMRLRDVLTTCAEPLVFLPSVDMFLLDNVSNERMSLFMQFMIEKGNIFRGAIRHIDALEKHRKTVEVWNGLEIIQCAEPKHCSTAGVGWGHSLYSTEILADLLENFWDIWECEAHTLKKEMDRSDITSVGIYPALFHVVDLSRTGTGRGQSSFWHLEHLTASDRLLVEAAMPMAIRWT